MSDIANGATDDLSRLSPMERRALERLDMFTAFARLQRLVSRDGVRDVRMFRGNGYQIVARVHTREFWTNGHEVMDFDGTGNTLAEAVNDVIDKVWSASRDEPQPAWDHTREVAR